MKSLLLHGKQDIGNRDPSVAKRLFSSVARIPELEGPLRAFRRATIYALTIGSALLPLRCSETTLVGVSPPDASGSIDIGNSSTKNEVAIGKDTDYTNTATDAKKNTVEKPVDVSQNEDIMGRDTNISAPDSSDSIGTTNKDVIGNDSSNPPQPDYMYTVKLQDPDPVFFPLAGKDNNLLYYPIPNPDFSDGLQQLDAKLTIIPMKNKVYPDQDLDYIQELSENNILPGSPNKFVFTIPTEGAYWWLLSYTLHYEDGNSIEYPDYTSAIGKFKEGGESVGNGTVIWPMAFTGYYFLVVPPLAAQPLTEIIAGQNDATDKNRYNVVFMHADGFYNQWDDTDPNDNEMLMKGIKDMITGKFGPFNVEPLKSNQNKFNFWYYEGDATYTAGVSAYELLYDDEYILGDMSDYQKLMQGLSLTDQIIVNVRADKHSGGKLCAACASGGGIIIDFPKGDIQECQKTHSLDDCIAEQKVSRILTHELGHKIAYLPDEYEDKGSIENPNNGPGIYYPYNLGPGGDTTVFTGKIMEEDCVQPDTDTNGETCVPNQGAIDFCLKHARWRDLIGNGCGEDGIVDCDADDPLFRAEVSCSYAGAGWPGAYISAHTTKSTEVSIMDWSGKFFNIMLFGSEFYEGHTKDVKDYELYDGRFYGQVNERQLCRYIMLLTGSIGGICNTLCLDGCKGEQKCVEGECEDI